MKTLLMAILIFAANYASADEEVLTTVDSLTNLAGSTALEVCGTSIHKNGKKPLLVTIQHDESFYTTLTAPNNKWCAVIKRWTNSGKIDVSAIPLNP